MDWDAFEEWGHHIASWSAEYRKTLREKPVRAQTKPGEILDQLPLEPPNGPIEMGAIMADFERIITPGLTHWQHPRFFAYFPSSAAPPSILAEQIVSTLAVNCLLWQTSPAATELETRMMEWLVLALGLPPEFSGVIQDSASSATLAAVLTMRERALNWNGNDQGLRNHPQIRIYCSDQVHSSIDRAIWVSGIGQNNLIKIPSSGPLRAIDTAILRVKIEEDLASGFLPAGIIAVTGATGMGACDDIFEVVQIAKKFDLYTHIDAAWAGSAMICPELREVWRGADEVDSIVFNPYKWLGAQFDCSVHFIRDPDALRQTLAIRPEYLRTHTEADVIDYSEWSIPLGRRFRALKLWFLIRAYGLETLRERIRNHIRWSMELAKKIEETNGFEIVTQPIFSLFTFRYVATGDPDSFNQKLVDLINDEGMIYITQTILDGKKVIRFQVGQFDCTKADVEMAYDVIVNAAKKIA